MKFNQTRHLILLILLINLATTKLNASDSTSFVPDPCGYMGTIVMPETDYCGPYILLDNGLKIRPNDTLLANVNARVRVGFQVVDSTCGGVLGVHLTCLQIFPDTSSCRAAFRYEMLRCSSDSLNIRCPDNTYRFYNLSNVVQDSVMWSFGDNSFSNELYPVHSFPNPGIYNICLTLFAFGGCQSTSCQTLVIQDTSTVCHAEIEYLTSDSIPFIHNRKDSLGAIIYPGYPVLFRDVTKQEVVERIWDFGDGTYSREKEVMHFYRNRGIYNVCLTIQTNGGCTDMQCIRVSVGVPDDCKADFIYRKIDTRLFDRIFPEGYTYELTDLSGSDEVRRIWVINGDSIFNLESVYYTFTRPGSYVACLITINPTGCVAYECKTIQVGSQNCELDFNYDIVYPDCYSEFITYQFTPFTGTNVLKYKWSFCDSTFSEDPYPIHLYKTSGKYKVCLTVYFEDSCNVSVCKTIVVPEMPKYQATAKCGQTGIDQRDIAFSGDNPAYPNPADQKINIRLNSNEMRAVDIRIIDVFGQDWKQAKNVEIVRGENTLEIGIEELPTGNYFYILSSPSTTLHGKFSVVR